MDGLFGKFSSTKISGWPFQQLILPFNYFSSKSLCLACKSGPLQLIIRPNLYKNKQQNCAINGYEIQLMQTTLMDIAEVDPESLRLTDDLNNKYFKQNPDYRTSIIKNSEEIDLQCEQILRNYLSKRQLLKYIKQRWQQQKEINARNVEDLLRNQSASEIYHQSLEASVNIQKLKLKAFQTIYRNKLQVLNSQFEAVAKKVEEIETTIDMRIFWEKNNFQRAKMQDQQMSRELRSMSKQQIASTAAIRFEKSVNILQYIKEGEKQRQSSSTKQFIQN